MPQRANSALQQHPDQMHFSLQQRLIYLTSCFSKLKQAQEDQKVAQMKKVQADLDQTAKALVKAQEKLKTFKSFTSSMALTSKEQISRNSAKFGWQQLRNEATQRVLAFRTCSKCRWQSGCVNCEAKKRLRYEIFQEAKKSEDGISQ